MYSCCGWSHLSPRWLGTTALAEGSKFDSLEFHSSAAFALGVLFLAEFPQLIHVAFQIFDPLYINGGAHCPATSGQKNCGINSAALSLDLMMVVCDDIFPDRFCCHLQAAVNGHLCQRHCAVTSDEKDGEEESAITPWSHVWSCRKSCLLVSLETDGLMQSLFFLSTPTVAKGSEGTAAAELLI